MIAMPMWVIYDHPRDYPDCFVARLWDGLNNKATSSVLTASTIEELEAKLPPDLYRLERQPGDDPTIMGVWL